MAFDPPTRLFGVPGAEILYGTLNEAYESAIEPWLGDSPWLAYRESWEIEEWTVSEPITHLPRADTIIEYILEMADLVTEDWWENANNAGDDDDVVEAFRVAIELLASKITYRMADKHVASHWITLAEDGPLVNGEPLYRPSVPPPSPSQP